jgi:hypothetical protein
VLAGRATSAATARWFPAQFCQVNPDRLPMRCEYSSYMRGVNTHVPLVGQNEVTVRGAVSAWRVRGDGGDRVVMHTGSAPLGPLRRVPVQGRALD